MCDSAKATRRTGEYTPVGVDSFQSMVLIPKHLDLFASKGLFSKLCVKAIWVEKYKAVQTSQVSEIVFSLLEEFNNKKLIHIKHTDRASSFDTQSQ